MSETMKRGEKGREKREHGEGKGRLGRMRTKGRKEGGGMSETVLERERGEERGRVKRGKGRKGGGMPQGTHSRPRKVTVPYFGHNGGNLKAWRHGRGGNVTSLGSWRGCLLCCFSGLVGVD